MADDQVLIEFGAKIDQLISAVGQVNSHLQEVADHGSELNAGFEKLGERIIEAFSVEAILHFIESMSQLGLQVERVMGQLGMTADQTVRLSGVAALTGTSLETLALGIERLSLNVQHSTRDAFTPQAQALQVLGLHAKDLIGIPTDQYIDKVQAAVSKFNPSLNVTNALMQLGGRGFANMIPLLIQSGEHYAELKARVDEASKGLGDAIPILASVHLSMTTLGLSTRSLGAQVMTVFGPIINGAIKVLTDWTQRVRDSIKDHGLFYYAIEAIAGVLRTLVTGFITLDAAVQIATISIKALWATMNGQTIENWSDQVSKVIEKMKADINSLSGTSTMTVHGQGGSNAGAINEQARAQLEATIKSIETENALWQGWLNQQKTIYQAASDFWLMTNQQKLQATKDATTQTYQSEAANMQRIIELYQGAGLIKEAAQMIGKMRQLWQQYQTDVIKINADMVRDIQAKITDVMNAFQSSFNSHLKGLLSGTESFGQAFKAVLGDMLIFFITTVEKMVFQWAAAQIAMAVAGPAVTGPKAAAFTSDITADSARAYAGVFATLAPVLGPAAEGPAELARTNILAQLAFVPKFEMGTDYVPKTGLAVVHEGERIITAQDNKAGGGAASFSFSVQAWDAQSVHQWLSRGGADQLASAISKSMGRNRSLRPAW